MRKLRPGRHLVAFAYSNYVLPPVRLKPDPDLVFFNVSGSYVTEEKELKARSNLAGWLSFGNAIVWRPNCLAGFECPCPTNFGRKLFDDIEAFKPNGIVGVSFDCCNAAYASNGFMFYMLAKAVLNPDRLDYDTLAADWLQSGFGPAASRIADYLAELERIFRAAARRAIGVRGYLEAMDVDRLDALLDAAEGVARGDADILARIAYLRVGVDHAREAKKVYRAWAGRSDMTLTEARDAYRAWIAEEGLRHPFEFPHSCTYLSGNAYNLAEDGELMDGEGPGELVLTDDRMIGVPAGTTNYVALLRGGPFALTKTGEGVLQIGRVATREVSVVVEEGEVAVVNPRPACLDDAFFHVDASAADTLVTKTVNDTNFVTRWNDADGRAARFAGPMSAAHHVRTDPENRLPYVTADYSATGLPVVDFGSFLSHRTASGKGDTTGAEGYGAALVWSRTGGKPICEFFTVAADDTTRPWPTHSSTRGIASYLGTVGGTAYGLRGSSGALFDCWDSLANTKVTSNDATVYLDGTNVPYSTPRPSAGLHVVNNVPGGAVPCDAFAHQHRKSSGSYTIDTYGGLKIGEFIGLKTAIADDEERARVNAHLLHKWCGAPKAARCWRNLTVPEGASLAVISENVVVSNVLSIGGTVTAEVVRVARLKVTAPGAEIVGTLDFGTSPGTVTVSIANAEELHGKKVKILGFTSSVGSLDNWTVVSDEPGLVLSLKSDGLYATFGKSGCLLLIQ